VLVAVAVACSSRQPSSYHPSYKGARWIDKNTIEFDDGDTFRIRGETIRVLGIDTPEIAHPDMGMDEDQPYGIAAAESTRVWITRGSVIEYVPDGRDKYGRRLAHVFVDGELLAVLLIHAGLAYETVSFYGDNGFPDLAEQVLEAARTAPKPDFEEPYKWKRKQRAKRSG
jgi:micrococcal nuclease